MNQQNFYTTGTPFPQNHNNDPNNDPIVIVGLGPVGLAMALESFKKSIRPVIAITDRTDYTRGQIFHIDQPVLNYIRSLAGDALFSEWLFKKKIVLTDGFYAVKAKHLEELLLTALRLQQNNPARTWNPLTILTLPKGGEKEIKSVDTVNNTLNIGDKQGNITQTLRFKYLIGADGSGHPTANMINKDFDRRNLVTPISYSDPQLPQTHDTHAVVSFNINPKILDERMTLQEDRATVLNRKINYYKSNQHLLTPPTQRELRAMGWTSSSAPEFRVIVSKNTFYIGSEAPPNLSTEQLKNWNRLMARYSLPPNEAYFYLYSKEYSTRTVQKQDKRKKKAALQATQFKIKLQEASAITVKLNNDAYFLQVGDALRAPHYHTGTGAQVGLQQAKAWGEFLTTQQSDQDLARYSNTVQQLRIANRTTVNNYLTQRAHREINSAIAHFAKLQEVANILSQTARSIVFTLSPMDPRSQFIHQFIKNISPLLIEINTILVTLILSNFTIDDRKTQEDVLTTAKQAFEYYDKLQTLMTTTAPSINIYYPSNSYISPVEQNFLSSFTKARVVLDNFEIEVKKVNVPLYKTNYLAQQASDANQEIINLRSKLDKLKDFAATLPTELDTYVNNSRKRFTLFYNKKLLIERRRIASQLATKIQTLQNTINANFATLNSVTFPISSQQDLKTFFTCQEQFIKHSDELSKLVTDSLKQDSDKATFYKKGGLKSLTKSKLHTILDSAQNQLKNFDANTGVNQRYRPGST